MLVNHALFFGIALEVNVISCDNENMVVLDPDIDRNANNISVARG